jgi:TldD protein
MKKITTRSFIKAGATAAAATIAAPILFRDWPGLAQAGATAYFEPEFGITDTLCRKALTEALAKGGDFADLFFEHTISNFLILEDGKVNRASTELGLGVGIRTVKDDQVGFGFTQELSEKSMLAAAATAATIADSAAKSPANQFVALKTRNFYPVKTLFSDVSMEPKLPLVQSVNEKCFGLSGLVTKVRVVFHDQQKRIMIVTSDGIKAEDLQPRSYLAATVVALKNGRLERAGWNFGAGGTSLTTRPSS